MKNKNYHTVGTIPKSNINEKLVKINPCLTPSRLLNYLVLLLLCKHLISFHYIYTKNQIIHFPINLVS
jgi:hypothetical protein